MRLLLFVPRLPRTTHYYSVVAQSNLWVRELGTLLLRWHYVKKTNHRQMAFGRRKCDAVVHPVSRGVIDVECVKKDDEDSSPRHVFDTRCLDKVSLEYHGEWNKGILCLRYLERVLLS